MDGNLRTRTASLKPASGPGCPGKNLPVPLVRLRLTSAGGGRTFFYGYPAPGAVPQVPERTHALRCGRIVKHLQLAGGECGVDPAPELFVLFRCQAGKLL